MITPRKSPCGQPKRHKLALLTFVGLLAPVYLLPPALPSVLAGSRLLAVGVTVAAIVVLMTYLIMPVLTYLAGEWLCEQPAKAPGISSATLHLPQPPGDTEHEQTC